jgi:predicted nucleic acid-binding protein
LIHFLDTSVLVPLFLKDHPHHARSLKLFLQCNPDNAGCAAHSLLETYSTLTRIPLPYRATPAEAILLVRTVFDRLKPIGLDPVEYLTALEDASSLAVVGGAVYDFLIYRCALKANAVTLYTWNLRHYSRFGPGISRVPE